MLVTGPHRILFTMLNRMLNKKYGDKYNPENNDNDTKQLKSKSATLIDFGVRIKISVHQVQGISQIVLQATFLDNDYVIHEETTMGYLRTLYGTSIGCSSNRITRSDDGGRQHNKVVITVKVNNAITHFDSTRDCAMSLSQIRVQAVGAPILNALRRMDDNKRRNSNSSCSSGKNVIYKLGKHGKQRIYFSSLLLVLNIL